ncbi:MAG: DUF1329 domain-containing protein [Myxococcota bacterium]|nr:DUF1329 domain-containing protein [Myxococcota bacterium]
MRWRPQTLLAAIAALALTSALAVPAFAAEDTDVVGPAFKEGDVITMETIDKLRPYLPPEFWANRDFFFYEGMKLEIGPAYRDYSEPPQWVDASEKFKGQAKIGPEGSLSDYTAGYPFDPDTIDCEGDPQAGVKHMWNFDYQWEGDGSSSRYFYSYWDRGEELPLYYEGTAKVVRMSNRIEADLLEQQNGDLFRGEKRKSVFGIEVDAPFDARGILVLTYRYKDSDKTKAEMKNDDTWVYVPTLRRVRRISTAQRTDAVSGTDFTFDDLRSFSGIVPQYTWQCLGEMEILAPMNSKVRAYPYVKDHNFGPYGLSYADDRWELRKAFKVRMTPNNADHPYHHKDIYVDKETYTALYSFAYDQKEELWKVIWHNHRWSQDDWPEYQGWAQVPEPNDLKIISDTIVNVQTGTGNRIEFWDSHGTPFKSKGKIRRYIDVGRLTKGR